MSAVSNNTGGVSAVGGDFISASHFAIAVGAAGDKFDQAQGFDVTSAAEYLGLNEEQFSEADADGNGAVNYDEFRIWRANNPGELPPVTDAVRETYQESESELQTIGMEQAYGLDNLIPR